jgi:DNA ligase (NAD+)
MITVADRTFEKVQDLAELVVHAATQYEIQGYAEDFDGTEITDPEYDALIRQLKSLDPDSPALLGTSPSEAKSKGKIVVHDPPMTSIAKADGENKEAIYQKWINDCCQRLGVHEIEIAQSYKHDGIALRVNYVKGKLVSAGLRPRDGIHGTDVTSHVKYIAGVPNKLPLPLTLSLNGEIECWHEDFEKVNAARDAVGEEPYKNPRNYTAGCLGRDDAEVNKDAGLRVTWYGISGFKDWHKYYKTEVERSVWAHQSLKLDTFVIVDVHEFSHLKILEQDSEQLSYYTDGIVLKVNNLELQEELGHVGDNPANEPRGALAWKFAEESCEAVISRIEWNASRTGRIVPTAIFDVPFVLNETANTRATCNNYGWMESQGLGAGAKVRCIKGGKIIPKIVEVLVPVNDIGAPTHCPSCGFTLTFAGNEKSGSKDLVCVDSKCPSKHVKSWTYYFQKIGGKGLGLATMEKIFHSGKVHTLVDLYKLKLSDLIAAGLTERQSLLALATIHMVQPVDDNAELLAAIEKAPKHKLPAWQFISALGIDGAGSSIAKALIQRFGDLDKIINATEAELEQVEGIGSITAGLIVFYFLLNKDMVKELSQCVDLELPKTGSLTNMNFVLTGSFALGKKHWEQRIVEKGGNVQSSVGKTTNFLVQEFGKTDGTPSEKEKKANLLGVKILSVKELEQNYLS